MKELKEEEKVQILEALEAIKQSIQRIDNLFNYIIEDEMPPYTVTQAADYLGITRTRVYNLTVNGALRPIQGKSKLVFPPHELKRVKDLLNGQKKDS